MGKTWMKDSDRETIKMGMSTKELDQLMVSRSPGESKGDMLEMSIQPSGSELTESHAYGGGIHSRAQAYGLLNAVEVYFARLEPRIHAYVC